MITNLTKPYASNQVKKLLHPYVDKWFFNKFKSFSLPQLYGVMEIHSRNNILVSAPTGATKTLTAFLSILNELIDSSEKGILQDKIYCVYVSPLRALSRDVEKNLKEPLAEMEKIAGKKFGIRVMARTGDTTQSEKTRMLKTPPHILITTPESLAILLASKRFIDHLQDVEWCVVDEIHALADNKRGVHLSLSLERLSALSSHMTRIGLSATISPIEEIAKFLVGYEKVNEGSRSKSKIGDLSGKSNAKRKDGKWQERNCKIVNVQFIKDLDIEVLSPVKNLIGTEHEVMHKKMYELMHDLIQEHKTTLVFTNTRAATERVVDYLKDKFPRLYGVENLGAHHGSLSRELRTDIEDRLKKGKLKAIVSSTSLELGIDIGYIDLVILLGSPKSVARAIQRVGRAGHQLHQTAKGRIIVLDRDDLIECSVLLKSAIEKRIDKIHLPTNCLDVLAQQMHGIAIQNMISVDDLFDLVRGSYCYQNLKKTDFLEVLSYLAGEFSSLESRYIYAKIWWDHDTNMVGKKGVMTRVIHMTNIGTIPDQSGVSVKIGNQMIGTIDEAFLEKLKPGDVFVLGGSTYRFKFSRGMVAQVTASAGRPPTVPRWSSESLPLSFDLALEIGRFRRLVSPKLSKTKSEVIKFIKEYLYVKGNAAESIYNYCKEQNDYQELPSDKKIIIEHYNDGHRTMHIFHSLFGRRVNDCLSRALAFAISHTNHVNVEIGINDNGFYLASDKSLKVYRAITLIKSSNLRNMMHLAIADTEIFKRRFRHCATRALMILRNYKGKKKRVGRQQVSSMILISALKRISDDFSILKEARREVLEDLMDIDNTINVVKDIEDGKIKVKEINTTVPTPFAFKIVIQGYSDIMKIDDKIAFLKKMHEYVQVKIALDKGKKGEKIDRKDVNFNYYKEWDKAEKKLDEEKDDELAILKMQVWNLKRVPVFAKEEFIKLIDGKEEIRTDVVDAVKQYKKQIEKTWPKEIRKFVFDKLKNKL